MSGNNLSLNGLTIDVACLGEILFCTKVFPFYKYVNGEKTEEVAGMKYYVIIPSKDFASLGVKVPNSPNQKALDIEKGGYVAVRFDNLELKLYYDSEHQLQISATATAIHKIEK